MLLPALGEVRPVLVDSHELAHLAQHVLLLRRELENPTLYLGALAQLVLRGPPQGCVKGRRALHQQVQAGGQVRTMQAGVDPAAREDAPVSDELCQSTRDRRGTGSVKLSGRRP